jgi:TP901 family phage tail tape measure protein
VAAIVINIAGSYDDRAISQAQRRLESLKRSGDAASMGMAGAFTRFGRKMQEVGDNISAFGRKMTLGVTLPIVGIGVAAVNIQKDFEQSMNQLAVMTGAPQRELTKLSDLAKQMGADTVFSAGEAADAMLELAKAGFTPAQIAGGGLQATMALAATEGIGLADSATIVTQAMNAFGLSAKDAMSAVDILAAGAVASTASVEELSGGLKYVGATAGTMGIPLSEVVTGLASLSNAGIDGTTAGTSLNRMLLSLAGTTAKSAAVIKDYGLEFYDANGQVKPMVEIVGELQEAFGKLDDKTRTKALKDLFGVEGMRAANILIGEGTKGYNALSDAVTKQGVAQELADARMSGTAGAIEQLKGSLETAALTIGEALAPAIRTVAGFIKDLADRFTSLSPQAQTIIMVIAGIAAAIGPLLVVAGSLVSAIGAISVALGFLAANPVVLAIIGIVAAIAALAAAAVWAYNKFEGFRNGVQAVWEGIQAAVAYVVDWFQTYVGPIISDVLGAIQEGTAGLADAFNTHWPSIQAAVQAVASWFAEYVWPLLDATFQALGMALTVLWGAYKTYWGFIWNLLKAVIEWFAANVWPKIQTAFVAIGAAVAVLWNAYRTYWNLIWNLLKSVIEWITGTLVPAIQRGWDVVKAAVQSLWEKFQTGFNLIKSHVETVINAVISALRKIGDVVATVVGFFDSIRKGVVDKFTEAVDFVRGIPGKIITAIGNVATTLYQSGVDLIQGLINGIRAKAGEVLSTIASTITDKIPQWVKDRLGISSPSKVMMEIGKWIPKGLAEGIRRNADDVEKAMADLAKRAAEKANTAARSALDGMKDKAREVIDYIRDVRDSIKDFGGVMGTQFDKGTLTAQTVIDQMQDRLRVATNFAAAITQLQRLGLNSSSLQSIIQAGPESGLEIAQALAAGGSAAIGEVNRLERLLGATGSAIGDIGAQDQYGMSGARAAGYMGSSVRVESGAIVLNFGDGLTGQDRTAIQQAVSEAVQDALRDLAREIRAS